MPWVKTDDAFYDHPKARAAGDIALSLFFRGNCYASRWLTDGFLPEDVVQEWASRLCRHGAGAIERLLRPPPGFEYGLWEKVEGGYLVHDYLDYSPSRKAVLAERAAAKERKDRWKERRSERDPERSPERSRNGGKNDAHARAVSRPVPSHTRTHTNTSSPTPSPPGPTVTDGGRALSGVQTERPGNGGLDPETRFVLAHREKLRELMTELDTNPHDPRVREAMAVWEHEWRPAHDLGPREAEAG